MYVKKFEKKKFTFIHIRNSISLCTRINENI